MQQLLASAAISSLLILAACSPDSGGSTCAVTADCPTGQVCVDGTCHAVSAVDGGGDGRDGGGGGADGGGADATCGGEAIPFDYRPPNVLIVFDRSCSMRRFIDASDFGTGPEDPATRWNIAREAVRGLITRYETRVFWGLMAYPDPREGCGLDVTAEVPPGPGTRAAIEAQLLSDTIQPFGLCGPDNTDMTTQPRDTPTANALMSASALPELSDPMRASFIVLVTDGGVSCGVTNPELMTLASGLVTAGIPLAVVGFATGATEPTLEALASSGGIVNPDGPPSYYVADSGASLDRVFDEIAERVVSCDLPLSSTPPDGEAIYVAVNDEPLAEDPANGWTYDASTNTITLEGSVCDQLRHGDVRRISVAFGCAPYMCTPSPEICNGLDDDCDDVVDEDCLV